MTTPITESNLYKNTAKLLPKDERESYAKELEIAREAMGEGEHWRNFDSNASTLSRALVWGLSPQGHLFWQKIRAKMGDF